IGLGVVPDKQPALCKVFNALTFFQKKTVSALVDDLRHTSGFTAKRWYSKSVRFTIHTPVALSKRRDDKCMRIAVYMFKPFSISIRLLVQVSFQPNKVAHRWRDFRCAPHDSQRCLHACVSKRIQKQ